MQILRARVKPYHSVTEFISIPSKIKSLINKNKGDEFHFVINDNNMKSVKEFGPSNINSDLVGKTIQILNSQYFAKFGVDGGVEIVSKTNESLPMQKSIDQLKMVRKISKGIDIADRIPDLMKQGANIHYSRNVIDSGIESFQDFEKNNKKFIPSWNLKHLISPFSKKRKKKK
jgi:RNase P/RNase MRP subunit p29